MRQDIVIFKTEGSFVDKVTVKVNEDLAKEFARYLHRDVHVRYAYHDFGKYINCSGATEQQIREVWREFLDNYQEKPDSKVLDRIGYMLLGAILASFTIVALMELFF